MGSIDFKSQERADQQGRPLFLKEETLNTPKTNTGIISQAEKQLRATTGDTFREAQKKVRNEMLMKGLYESIVQSTNYRLGQIKDSFLSATGFKGPEEFLGPFEAGVQVLGALANIKGDAEGATLIAAVRSQMTGEQEEGVKESIAGALETPTGQFAVGALQKGQEIAKEHPREAKTLGAYVTLMLEALPFLKTSKPLSALDDVVEHTIKHTIKTSIPTPKPPDPPGGGLVSGLVERAKELSPPGGFVQRLEINSQAKQQAKELFKMLPPDEQEVVRLGLRPRDVALVKGSTVAERQTYGELLKAVGVFEAKGGARPEDLIAQPVHDMLSSLNKEVKKAGKVLDTAIAPLGDQALPDLADNIITRMQNIPGLAGIRLSEEGVLDFTDTAVSGTRRAAERSMITTEFNDAVSRGAKQAHKLRQELFEELGGRTRAGVKTTDTADKALGAIREGISDSLDVVSDTYKQANQEIAELLTVRKEFIKRFGDAGDEDLFNATVSTLARRLTNNTLSGPEMAKLLRDTEFLLAKRGIEPGVSLTRLQEFMNIIDRNFDIAKDTSMLGILRMQDVPTGSKDLTMKVLSKIFDISQPSPETAKEALKKLLGLTDDLGTSVKGLGGVADDIDKIKAKAGNRRFGPGAMSPEEMAFADTIRTVKGLSADDVGRGAVISRDIPSKIEQIRSGEIFGHTYNVDGSAYTGDNAIVTLSSKTFTGSGDDVAEFIAKNDRLFKHKDVKVGVFDMGDGKFSVDINVETPSRQVAERIARINNQHSYWDAKAQDIFETGGTGEQVLSDKQIDEIVKGIRSFNADNSVVMEAANAYQASRGLPELIPDIKFSLDTDKSKRIADAFDSMVDAPNDPKVLKAYNSLASETKDQFEFLVEQGYKMEPWEGKGQPYKDSVEMANDLSKNKHLFFFKTDDGFGSGVSVDHPLLRSSGIKVNGKDLKLNDLFRAVHDVFGHAKLGNNFGPLGEENAWKIHSQMYTDDARRALTTETRGQNSWVNFNKKLRNPDGSVARRGDKNYVSIPDRPFADQKTGLLSDEFVFDKTP